MVNKIFLYSFLLLFGTSLQAAEKGGLQDPLRPLGFQSSAAPLAVQLAAAKTSEWRLGAVLVSAERAVAVINGQTLQVGDFLDGYELIKIESSQVLLQKKQKEVVLRRNGSGLKKAFLSQDVTKGSQP